jgi:hypothetical protein
MIKVNVDRHRRTITFRASGTLTLDDVKRTLDEARWATDLFKGGEHIVLADLRGMAVLSPEVATVFGEVIQYGRMNGTAWCVHLSDSSVGRLQAARLARDVSPQDKTTINVVSLDEAEKVIEEKYPKIRGAALSPASAPKAR